MFAKVLACAFLLLQLGATSPHFKDVKHLHTHYFRQKRSPAATYTNEESSADYWARKAQSSLNAKLTQKPNTNVAKNVIMFLGDGMSIPTLAAARAYLGQMNGKTGEEVYLSFEEFPYTALSKTYCVDSQVADSACSATAYLCGVKANLGTIGVTAAVPLGECGPAAANASTHVSSIGKWSQLKGKRTGIVTTTRVTHASPSGVYSHTAHRDWESDFDTSLENINTTQCKDIADQLINGDTGSNFNVILGGGRVKMIPYTEKDEEGINGERLDGRNLIKEWLGAKQEKSKRAEYVWDRDGLLSVSPDTEHLLGLFESSHCAYNLDKTDADPTLAEMTEAAIKILSKGDKGYFLFVEGGRIDHAHHDTLAKKALDETVQFSEAIRKAREVTDEEDTLIVVTSDHAHTMSVSGYPERGNDIFGIAGTADDKLPYSTLSYANGPGYIPESSGSRHDLNEDNMHDKDYKFPSLLPLDSETHGGDDVGVFAVGPWAHLFRGVIEQNVIPHIMAYASCVGNGATACDNLH